MKTEFLRLNMYYGADSATMGAAIILRRNMTHAERVLWKRLKDKKMFSVKFRRQHPVKFFIVDFYCHELKLVIEVDGEVHNDPVAKECDLGRTAELNKLGLTVIRFTNDEVFCEIDSVVNSIQHTISTLIP